MLRPPHLGADLRLDAELLAQLAAQALLHRFTRLALAAGELPLASVRLIRPALTGEDTPVPQDDSGAYVDQLGHAIVSRQSGFSGARVTGSRRHAS